jgi:outer membrane protein assembly factor BamE
MFCPNYRLMPAVALCLALSACSNVPRFFNEYKIDIQQGNVLSQEMVSQLKPGQTRDQVRFLLGTPMITDVFHQQRWDYVYSFRNGATGQTQSRRFSVYFDNEGLLARVDGDIAVADVAELTAPVARSRVVDMGSIPEAGVPMPPPEEPSYYRRFMDMIGF